MSQDDDTRELSPQAAAATVNEVEGFLLVQAEWDTARREGKEFADRLPWLTTAQHEEVARVYAEQRMRLTRRMLRTVVSRAHSLRDEYENRYTVLRVRLWKLSTLAVCSAVLWTVCLTTWVYSCLGE
ncbi:hypothetical protein [Streptomyces sporangiiformans]|uniref:Cytochrome C oxidase subunit I n=1 Tax=Streptomyces sporangiiformans TaxID=2315329 RepID=A0A505DD76_9ACTN|nr:hypothetical protein [Streptomyces sporangiiformans]TPQ17186.1 hypothetical protein FGD71_037760 [Streptomyces sporangiiformans]